jgi:type II secretory pathway component GspD/PulD (secretin)
MNCSNKIMWLIPWAAGLFTAVAALAADVPGADPAAETFRDDASHASTATSGPAATSKTNIPGAKTDKGLLLNFHSAPLSEVLNYLSEAAGFIVVQDTDVKGRLDVWSSKPLNREEAVDVLNAALNKNGYAAIQNGRTLTIVKRNEVGKKNIPVKKGNNPNAIPSNTEIVTQVIPVSSLNVAQLPKDLAPLLSSDAILTANEAGNSLLMTDTQANIRRITEIIKALDTVGATMNTIRVFPLKYVDAKALAEIIKELFPAPDTSRPGGNLAGPGRFRGNGGGRGGSGAEFAAMAAMVAGGFGGPENSGGNGGANDNNNSAASKPASRVSAVADDHGNALIVSAPDAVMPSIEQLIDTLDVSIQDLTEVRLFRLQNADPTEMVELLNGLFPDENNSNDAINSARQFAFGGFRGGPFGGFGRVEANPNNQSTSQSERAKRMGRVIAVADARTSSLVVCAARDLMPQIDSLVRQLDANGARRQKIHIVSLSNADPQDVQSVLQDLFPPPANSRNNSSLLPQNNPLSSRSQTLLQQQQQQPGGGVGFGASPAGSGGRGF